MKRRIKIVNSNSTVRGSTCVHTMKPMNRGGIVYPPSGNRIVQNKPYTPIPVASINESISFKAKPETHKVAFMFLTLESLHHGKRWHKFLEDGKDRCTMYSHPKYPEHIKQKFLTDSIISRRVPTRWANISLVKASNLMLVEALKDPDNKFFMLLSEKCLPLYDFDYTYETMTRQNKSWLFNYKWTGAQNHNRWKNLYKNTNGIENPLTIRVDQFYKQSQWMVLNRKHAEIIASTMHLAHQFKSMSAPDEHYYINILKNRVPLFHKENINHPITFVNWVDSQSGNHPLDYQTVNLDEIRKLQANEYFKQTINSSHTEPHLFMRKVPYTATIKD